MFIKKNNKIYEQNEKEANLESFKETLKILKKERQNAIDKADNAFEKEIDKLEKDIKEINNLK